MMNVHKNQIWFFVLAGLLAVVLSGCGVAAARNQAANGALETVTLTRGPMTVMIGATGSVRAGQTALLTWQASGKVGQVLAASQQSVAAGELLASLDPTSLPQSILQAQVDLINAQNSLADLQKANPLLVAQAQDTLDQAQEALDNLLNPSAVAIAQAEVAVISAQDAVDKAQNTVDGLTRGRGNAEQINLARANYLLAQEKVDRMQGIYDETPGHHDEDPQKALALSNLEGAKNDLARALGVLNWYLGKPTEAEMAEKQADLVLAQAQLADAQQTLSDLKSPTENAISLARARVEDAQQALQDAQNGASADDLTIAETRVTQAQAALAQAGLAAPFAGTITEVSVMPGDLVSPGSQAFRIDDLASLYVDLEVSEVDIHQVKVGQPVSINFDAILDRSYEGEVYEIGQVGTANQGAVSFPVTVRMTNADASVLPGMTAIANITVAQAEDILQLPSGVIQEENGKRFVYLQPQGGAAGDSKQVYVQIGLTSDTASEVISSELKEGDQILVNAPGFFMMGSGQGPRGNGGQP